MTCVIPDADTVNRWFVAPVRDASPAWAVLPADAGEHDDRPPVATGLELLRDLLRDGLWHDRIIPRDIGDDTVTAMITAVLEPVLTTQLGFTMHCRMQPMGTMSCTRLLLRHPKDGAVILDYGITRTGDGCRWFRWAATTPVLAGTPMDAAYRARHPLPPSGGFDLWDPEAKTAALMAMVPGIYQAMDLSARVKGTAS